MEMNKIIVYGYGRIYERIKDLIQNCRVIAIADINAGQMEGRKSGQIPLILPEEIQKYEYDYVAISSPGQFENMKQQLVCENSVEENKIISLFMFVNGRDYAREEDIILIKEYLEAINVDEHNADPVPKILVSDDLEKLCEGIEMSNAKYAIYTAYMCPLEEDIEVLNRLGQWKRFSCPGQTLYVISLQGDFCGKTLKLFEQSADIYIVTHKRYGVMNDRLYIPIAVGGYDGDGFLTDRMGDSISQLNDKINECTAMYWIWKNANADIVGINHYRRFFYNNEFRCRENRLDIQNVVHILSEYDMIVYKAAVPEGHTVEYEMKTSLQKDVYDMGYGLILEKMRLYQQNYISDFYQVWEMKECCYCNMMVTSKKIYDAYCEWLFSFLIPAAKEVHTDGLDDYNKRVIGFFAERMLSVWLHHNQLKLKTLPVYIP